MSSDHVRVRPLDPNKGYRADRLWLPKSYTQNLRGLQAALTFPLDEKAPICAWGETSTHFVVPREFVPYERYGEFPFEMIDRAPKTFPEANYEVKSQLNSPMQRIGFTELVEQGGGVLSLPCGQGKTVVAIHAAAAVHMPALVVVHNSDLLEQWIDRFEEHTSLDRSDIGVVQQDTWNWEHPVAVAMIQTLVSRWDDVPEEMRYHFGTVIYDEVHHLGAPSFNTTAPFGYGIRWGLSATPFRSDGLDRLYLYHIGDVAYQTDEQDVIPEIYFVKTAADISRLSDDERRSVRVGNEVHIPKLLTWLCEDENRNAKICAVINEALADGRKILVLSDRVEHIENLHKRYQNTGLIHGNVPIAERRRRLYGYDLVFATSPLAKEGLDRKDLDTILIVTPFSDENRLRQILGRIQRLFDGKHRPVALIFDDVLIKECRRMCEKLRIHLTDFRYPFFDYKE